MNNTTIIDNSNTKKSTGLRLVAILLVLACIPERVSARYGTCSRRRWYHGNPYRHYGNSGFCSNRWDNRRCGRRCRRYRSGDLFDDIVEAGLNSLARWERARRGPHFQIQDHGVDGIELSLDTKGLRGDEIDLEVVETENGDRILEVRGISNTAELSESLALHRSIDVDGIRASVSSGVLKISLPRKKARKRIVPSLRDVLVREDPNYDDRIPVHKTERKGFTGSHQKKQKLRAEDKALLYDTQRGDFYGSSLAMNRKRMLRDDDDARLYDIRRGDFSGPSLKKKRKRRRSSRRPVASEESERRILEEEISKKMRKDDEDDDGLWISEEEDTW